jgi:hypothetical protein
MQRMSLLEDYTRVLVFARGQNPRNHSQLFFLNFVAFENGSLCVGSYSFGSRETCSVGNEERGT